MPTFAISADPDIIVHIMYEYPNHAIRYADHLITFVEPDDEAAIAFVLKYNDYIIAKTVHTLRQEYQLFVFAATAGLAN